VAGLPAGEADVVVIPEVGGAHGPAEVCRLARSRLVLAGARCDTAAAALRRWTQGELLSGDDLADILAAGLTQRLAARVCEWCSVPSDPPHGPEAVVGDFRRGRGCDECLYQGTSGRVGLFDVQPAAALLASLTADGAADLRGLHADAREKAACGVIPPEEIERLTLASPPRALVPAG
jgi:type II secretory ATPase GspE/PulE/Tfp pilus assembly ATPase PilB-like protein